MNAVRLLKILNQCHRRAAPAALCACLCAIAPRAAALDPQTRLADYNRTVWTARDGAPSHIINMTQTADGWIWIASASGFYRFDGKQFELYALPGQTMSARRRVHKALAAPDGGLLLTYEIAGGLEWLKADGHTVNLVPPDLDFDYVNQFARGPDGVLWTATERGLHSFSAGGHGAIGQAQGVPAGAANGVMVEPDGRLWLVHELGIYMRPPGAVRFDKVAGTAARGTLVRAPDGKIWLTPPQQDRVELLAMPDTKAAADVIESQTTSLFDRDGNLWTVTCPRRLCVLRPNDIKGRTVLHPAAQSKAVLPELTGQPSAIMEDRNGAIWIATDNSLMRLRDSLLTPVRIPDYAGVSMGLDQHGRAVAIGSGAPLAWVLDRNGPIPDRSERLQILTNSRDGAVLYAGPRELIRRKGNQEQRIALPPGGEGKPADLDVRGLQDDGKHIWMFSTQTGLMGYADRRWQAHSAFRLPPHIMLSTSGGNGRFWLADNAGGLFLYENDRLQRFDAALVGQPTLLDAGAPVLAAGPEGIAILVGKTLRKLHAANPAVLNNVAGIAVTSNGDRWLNGGMGVVHVRAADWRASMQDPALPLRYELLGAEDGFTGHALLDNRLPNAFADKDDQVWLGTSEGILHLDARRVAAADLPPPVRITALESDGRAHAVKDGLELPAAPRAINISYAAPGAARPELLRYQYRLVGEDTTWQDAGARRTAFFTSLAPGRHRFQVRVVSLDAGWEGQPAALEFSVTPTLLQNRWVQCMLALSLVALLFALHRWRLRLIAGKYRALLDERLDERNRIARELHDTLLQSVQGLMLKVQGAALRLPPAEPVRALLTSALDQAETTVSEGRQKVRALRSEDEDRGLSLAQLLTAVADELSSDATQQRLQVLGAARALAAGVGPDLFAIGREAMVNAWRHAGASQVQTTLEFGDEALMLRIADDGAGIPAAYAAQQGRDGHWGLAGMRERAATIGARFNVATRENGGSEISVEVPAALAYRDYAPTRRWRWPLRL